MAGLSENGFEVKRYSEVVSDQRSKAVELFGAGVDTSVNSILGQISQLSALELATLWEGLQDVHDAFNPNAAYGKSLDDLCSLVGVYRLDAEPTQGFIEFTGRNGVIVPEGTQVSNQDTGDTFSTTAATLISTDKAYSVEYQVRSVTDSSEYILNINGVVVSYTTGVGETVTDIRDGFVTGIQADPDLDFVSVDSIDSDKFVITHTIIGNSFTSSTNTSSLFPSSVTSLVYVRANTLGNISADTESITSIDTPVNGVTSVTNLTSLVVGRDVETDDELRIRRARRAQQAGKATPEAIARALENLQGVSDAFVVENRTLSTDVDGRPPKSYEAIVVGGEVTNIAETIWENGPAGIETYGNISQIVVDSNGDPHTISFSRPENVYISFEVDYQIYDEEVFPDDGEQAIRDAIVSYGNSSRRIGEDVIPQRFFGDIYRNVSGIENLVIRVGSSNSPSIPPVAFSTSPLPISSRELADFSSDRIVVSEV
jgi:uncharacterized phage protein gp47/JayE